MSGIAAARDRYDPPTVQRVSGWERNYLRRAALANLGCVIIGVFVVALLRFGNDVTGTHIALSLALPVLWPGLLDVTSRRTTISPTAGPALLHVDHRQIAGLRLVLKDRIDRCTAGAVLIVLFPLMAVLTATTPFRDRGSAHFTQVRAVRDGRASFAFDLQLMWKLVSVLVRRSELISSYPTMRSASVSPINTTRMFIRNFIRALGRQPVIEL
jgi:hypothetical protein